MAVIAAPALSEYEQQRLAHIRRNHEFLVGLGLADASVDPVAALNGKPSKPRAPRGPKKVKVPVPPESLRRSSRLQGQEVEYTHEVVDAFGDDDQPLRKKAKREASSDDDDDDAALDEMRAEAIAYLKEVREAQLALAVDAAAADGDDWKREAVRRWGPLAGGGGDRDWKLFVESRLSTPPPVSPLDFLQEYYAADTWRLLVSCILMSRVSSWNTKHTCISAFFELYATPSAFSAETDYRKIQGAIHSLGLFDDRLKSLVSLTEAFLHGVKLEPAKGAKSPRADEFKVELDRKSPHKIHGVGPFGHDSWLVFCKDASASMSLSKGGDPIAPFYNWRKKHAKAEVQAQAQAAE